MPLIGTLRDLSLPNLVQLQCGEQNNAQVYLTKGTCQGKLVFADGEIVHASFGDKTGAEAVYELLTWEEGDFRVTAEVSAVEHNVQLPWSVLLLEGLRLADERRAEHDAALEAALRGLKGKHGLRAALVATSYGQLRADAKDDRAPEDAALVAFVGERAQGIESLLNLGALKEILATNPSEKIMIRKLDTNYLGGWLESRANPDPIRAMLQSLSHPA